MFDFLKTHGPAFSGVLRHLLNTAGVALAAATPITGADAEAVIGALATIGSVFWSVAAKEKREHARRQRDQARFIRDGGR